MCSKMKKDGNICSSADTLYYVYFSNHCEASAPLSIYEGVGQTAVRRIGLDLYGRPTLPDDRRRANTLLTAIQRAAFLSRIASPFFLRVRLRRNRMAVDGPNCSVLGLGLGRSFDGWHGAVVAANRSGCRRTTVAPDHRHSDAFVMM